MRKSVLLLIALFAICLSVFADDSNIVEDSQVAPNDEISQIEPTVDKGLFEVKLTIPKDFVEAPTQEKVDGYIKENRIKSAIFNNDGGVTYVMSKTQYEENLTLIKESMMQALLSDIGSSETPNITNIEANENLSCFTITTKNDEPDFTEMLYAFVLFIDGSFYGAIAGEGLNNIHVDYVNAYSGEIIWSVDSDDMGSDS